MARNTSNRIGADFEKRLQKQFDKYRKEGKAYIFKCHVDWTVLRRGAKIVSAFPKKESNMLDFVGLLPNNQVFIFEAKSYNATGSKTPKPFPLSNVKTYQFDMNKELMQYAYNVFYIIEVRLEDNNEVYLLHAKDLQHFVDTNDRKSIPYGTLKDISTRVEGLDILKYLN